MEQWRLAAGYIPATWVLVIVTLSVGIALAEAIASWWSRPPFVTRRRASLMLALRGLALAALVGLVFEVTLRTELLAPTSRRIVVLIDRSASMGIADGEPTATRQSRLQSLWSRSQASREQWARDGFVVEGRSFDVQTEPYPEDHLASLSLTPTGSGSDLAGALLELAEPPTSANVPPVAAVVVLSDGLVASDGAAQIRLAQAAAELDVPLTTVSAGAPELRDIAIAKVQAGEFAFVENVTEIEATIASYGLHNETVRVDLLRDGAVVASEPLVLGPNQTETTIRFEVAPDRIGQFVYEIFVQPVADEATEANNRRAFVVKVLRDKVRVLHVAGRPDWDVRALRTLLRRDPNVELLSYYILRSVDDMSREDSTAELSLIAFPTDELFQAQLGSFDLVILHNFDAVLHRVAQYIPNMGEYLVEGGALVVIGGDLAFSDSGYAHPSLARWLPMDTTSPSPLIEHRYRPELTDAGRRHPITAWLRSIGGGWNALPELDTFNPLDPSLERDAIAASTLLVHPTAVDRNGQPRPLLAVSEPGRGRAMMLATGSSWRMGFAPDLTLVDGARPYDLLWLGAVRWLLRDESSGRLQLETDRSTVPRGEPIELRATTLSPSYAPESEVEVEWDVRQLEADEQDPPTATGRWTTDELGRAQQTLKNLAVGAYVVEAHRAADAEDAERHGDEPATIRRVFVVESPHDELARLDATPGIARLQSLADSTGGVALDARTESALPPQLPVADAGDDPNTVTSRSDQPLWSGVGSLLLFLLAFGGEWWLRRRS